MKTRFAKVLVLLTLVAAMVAMMAMPALAVNPVTVLDGQVTVSSDNATGLSVSDNTVTGNGKVGAMGGTKEFSFVVANTSGSTATISFKYSYSNTSSYSESASSGTKTLTLKNAETYTFKMSVNGGWIGKTGTLKLSDFTIEIASGSSDVTVSYNDSLGSVTAAGNTVASDAVLNVSAIEGVVLNATTNISGAKFLAWVNAADNSVLSTSASYNLMPTGAMSIRAVFAKSTAEAVFYADGTQKVFESLNAALTYASNASNKVITLASDGTLPAGNYTIPAGVTLNIPYDAAGTVCTTEPTIHDNAYTAPSVFRTLNMANGANLTVNGTLSLSAQMSSKYGYNGAPSGPLPFIKMAANSKITVETGAAMYVYGFVTGSGSVEVKSGATIYECFQIADYRGGDATSAIVGKDDEYGVFPFNQYYIQSVEVPLTIHAGATEFGFTALYVTLAGTQKSDVPFIGSDNSMFVLNSGYIVKDYVEGTGRLSVKLYGDVAVSTMSMSMKVSLIGNLTIDSSKYALPIAQHLTLYVESGNITMNQSVAFLPGSELYIREGAACELGEGKKIIIYDLDQWLYNNGANGYSGTTNLPYMQAKYVPGGNGVEGRLKDALIQVDGTIDATNGAVYATTGGANVYSTGTGKITLTPGTETVTYQVITNDTNIGSWPEIALIPGVLTDNDGTTISADVEGEYKYYAATGKWDKPGHRYETNVVPATCTTEGYTETKCIACGTSTKSDIVPAIGHTEVVDAGKAPTCTETGLTDGSHCSVCNEVLVAQEEIAALGHKYEGVATAPTCTEEGFTTYTCSVCDHSYVGDKVAALGHTAVIDAAVPATCTEAGLSEGKHCSECGEILVAQEVVNALGHSYGDWTVTVAPTYTEEGQQEQTCSACGGVVTASVPVLANPVNGWSIVLSDNIGVRFDMTLADTDTVAVTVNGNAAEYTLAEGILSINVAAAQMNDVIAITINGNALANTYSVRGYADYILDEANGFDEATKTLVENMLVYGGAAQTYFAYNAEKLASDGITVEMAAPEGDAAVDVTDNLSTLNFYGATLVHETKTAVRIYFTGSIEGLTFTVNGSEVNAIAKGDMYYVEIDGINPQDLGSDVVVAVNTDALTVAYSPLDYIIRMYNKADASANTVALVQAMYGYYLAAAAYTAA